MIGTIIYTALSGSSTITAIVGENVFPVVIPQAVKGPANVYAIGSNITNAVKDGPSTMDTYLFDVMSISKKYSEVDNLADKVRTALETTTATGVQSIRYQSEQDDFIMETEMYVRTAQFKIRINR